MPFRTKKDLNKYQSKNKSNQKLGFVLQYKILATIFVQAQKCFTTNKLYFGKSGSVVLSKKCYLA
jgi:hypothetical protein